MVTAPALANRHIRLGESGSGESGKRGTEPCEGDPSTRAIGAGPALPRRRTTRRGVARRGVALRGLARVRGARHGVATVELAILLPLLMVLVLGTIEVCSRAFLRQTAAVTAYEGARLAARRTISTERVVERCQTLLEGRNINGAVVTVTPADASKVATGELVQVRVEIPWQANTPSTMVLPSSGVVVVTASMLRE